MRKLIIAALLAAGALALVLMVFAPSPARDAEAWFPDLAYASASPRQTLDLYLPRGAQPFPFIVYIHGGGFKAGNKRAGNAPHIISAALGRGYAVASLNYRRSGEATFPAAVEDVFTAIRFLKTVAPEYGLAPDRMATWGDSAGGNLAAMAATRGTAEDGTQVQAAVDWFGPIVFDRMDAEFAALGLAPRLGPTDAPGSPESQYLGVAVGAPEAAGLVRDASPQSYITPDDPPMLIQHGTEDHNVPILQSQNFAEALARVIGPENVVFLALSGAGHGGDAFLNEENFARVFDFLDARLRP
ncbi:MAG: alpha/beta hydrolase [Myxococcota bacterium]